MDAQKYERILLAQKDLNGKAPDKTLRRMSFHQYFQLWFKECRGKVSDGWKKTQQQIYRDHIQELLKDRLLSEVSKRDIGFFLDHLKSKGLGSQSRLRAFNLLHKCFEDAIHHFEFMRLNPVVKRYRPTVERKERNFLTVNESWKLLDSIRGHWIEPAISISLLCGLRPGECISLNWQNVDLEKGRIIISSTHCRKEGRIKPYPKQKDWGEAPIPAVLLHSLKKWKLMRRNLEFVANRKQWQNADLPCFLLPIKKACREANITVVTPHELRHSTTEIWYQAGASKEDLRRLLNHSSERTTDTYIHRTTERISDIANKIQKIGGETEF